MLAVRTLQIDRASPWVTFFPDASGAPDWSMTLHVEPAAEKCSTFYHEAREIPIQPPDADDSSHSAHRIQSLRSPRHRSALPRPSVCELLDASTHDITAHHVFPGPYAPRPPPVRSSAHGCPQIRVQRRIQGRRRRQGVRLQGLQLRLRICLQGSAGSLQGHLGRWPRHLGRCQGRRQLPEQGRWPDRKTGRFRGEYVQTPSIPQLLALGPTVLSQSRPSSWKSRENE